MAHDTNFWNQLLMRSDSIADIDAQAPDAKERALAQLATINEQFDRAFDPADRFEEYVAVTLCQALQRALTPKVAVTCKMMPPKAAPVSRSGTATVPAKTRGKPKPRGKKATAKSPAGAPSEKSRKGS